MIASYNFPFKWISPFSWTFPFKWAFINASQHILISSIKLLESAPSKKNTFQRHFLSMLSNL